MSNINSVWIQLLFSSSFGPTFIRALEIQTRRGCPQLEDQELQNVNECFNRGIAVAANAKINGNTEMCRQHMFQTKSIFNAQVENLSSGKQTLLMSKWDRIWGYSSYGSDHSSKIENFQNNIGSLISDETLELISILASS